MNHKTKFGTTQSKPVLTFTPQAASDAIEHTVSQHLLASRARISQRFRAESASGWELRGVTSWFVTHWCPHWCYIGYNVDNCSYFKDIMFAYFKLL